MLCARLGSASRAAEALNLTQSAVSRAIRTLEDRLGVTLFLPTVAWVMWRGVMQRAERLREAVNQSWG